MSKESVSPLIAAFHATRRRESVAIDEEHPFIYEGTCGGGMALWSAARKEGRRRGKRTFPSSKDSIDAPLPQPKPDKPPPDFEGGEEGGGGILSPHISVYSDSPTPAPRALHAFRRLRRRGKRRVGGWDKTSSPRDDDGKQPGGLYAVAKIYPFAPPRLAGTSRASLAMRSARAGLHTQRKHVGDSLGKRAGLGGTLGGDEDEGDGTYPPFLLPLLLQDVLRDCEALAAP
ncbi:hypothetical protein EV122DRAFT_280868 [Schizophyllum commune]